VRPLKIDGHQGSDVKEALPIDSFWGSVAWDALVEDILMCVWVVCVKVFDCSEVA
jgi:hypothetical protein